MRIVHYAADGTEKQNRILTAKGDLLTRDSTTHVRLPVGNDGEVLTADSTADEGVAWKSVLKNSTLFSATADVTIANTTTESSMFGTGVGSLTIPANALAAGYTVRVTLFGYKSNPAAAGTITIRLKLGGNTLASVVVTPGTTTNTLVELRAMITCRSAGGSGTVLGQGQMQMPESVTANRYWDLVTTGGATTVDTTGTLALDVTWQWQTANANRTVTITNAVVELLPVA